MKHAETTREMQVRHRRARQLLDALLQLIPDAQMQLVYRNPWELLVAVELSAQCTDKQVNKVTKQLFHDYPDLDAYLHADPERFAQAIFSTGFYRNKAKNILAAARMIRDEFHGDVPRTMEEILRVPGVARKTANVVLGNAYGIVEGIAVDTHVKRFAQAFGLSDETDPVKIERDLMEVIPRDMWFHATYLIIEYGRRYCPARCAHRDCPLRKHLVSR